MDTAITSNQAQSIHAETQAPSLRLPDAGSTADVVLRQAMDYCAQKVGAASTESVVQSLKVGDKNACSYCRYSVAKQIGEALGALDENVKAAFMFDDEATYQDVCFGPARQTSPIHLLVWVERKTGALASLVEALDQALAKSYAGLLGSSPTAHVLDTQVIDDADVESNRGYGALLRSLHNRPIKVWAR